MLVLTLWRLGHEITPRRPVELSCLCFLGRSIWLDHLLDPLLTWPVSFFLISLYWVCCARGSFPNLHFFLWVCSVPVSTFVKCTCMCGRTCFWSRNAKRPMNLEATLLPHMSNHLSCVESHGATGATCAFWELRPKEGKGEKLEQRQITPARHFDMDGPRENLLGEHMSGLNVCPIHIKEPISVRFDPPPREPKGPKVSLPEKLEVSIELRIEKEGKEEEFPQFWDHFINPWLAIW